MMFVTAVTVLSAALLLAGYVTFVAYLVGYSWTRGQYDALQSQFDKTKRKE